MITPQTLKGFRDFLPRDAIKRQKVIEKIRKVFELFGFDPLETPALEYADVLLGKYGEEADKLIYRFKDRGGREVGLRYDLTVPLARIIASYPILPMPFKRYQIQPVWRADKPQTGRFREFLQCDADIVGTTSPLADAEMILVAVESLQKLGFKKFKILINDRELFSVLKITSKFDAEAFAIIRIIDKLEKIGIEGVINELVIKGFSKKEATEILNKIKNQRLTKKLLQIFSYLEKSGIPDSYYDFSPTLARGLDYYTSTIFEIKIDGYMAGSVGGGGRYDKLIGKFIGQDLPAVGFSFGIDRLIEAMEQQGLFIDLPSTSVAVLVTIFSPEYLLQSIKVTNLIRQNGINCELFLDAGKKLDKQLKYADKKGIPFVAIIGPDEAKNGTVTLKNLQEKKQETVPLDELVKLLRLALSGVEG